MWESKSLGLGEATGLCWQLRPRGIPELDMGQPLLRPPSLSRRGNAGGETGVPPAERDAGLAREGRGWRKRQKGHGWETDRRRKWK